MDPETLLDSIPTPIEADMLALRDDARQYTLVFLRKGPASQEDEGRGTRISRRCTCST